MLQKHWPSLLFLLFLVLITYANSFNNVFLSDDLAEIVQNPNVGNFSNILAHPFGIMRPFLYFSIFHMGGLNPALFRSINIFFHIGSVFAIYVLLNLLYWRKLALFVAAIFAVHPAISEAVVWISGGMYPQYTFFFLLSFIFYILSAKRKFYYLLSTIYYLLSFVSHPQMPLSLFLVFPLWELVFGNLRKNWKKSILFVTIAIVYVLVSFAALPERETTLQSVHYQERGIDNPILLIPVAITSYFELIFFPKTLTLYHSELQFGQIGFIIRFLITLTFLAAILFSFKRNKHVFFWSLFFLIALAPTLTPFRLNWIVAERYLYLPILGLLVLLGFGLDKIIQIKKVKWAGYTSFILIVTLLSIRTIIRNIDWKNEDNLWIATGKTSPSSPNNHNNLGDVYGRHGDKQRALQEFQTAIALKPNYGDAYHNLANTYRELGKLDKALENYQKALQFNPNLWQSHQNMAAIYYEKAQYDKTLEQLNQAVKIAPKIPNLWNNLGVVYLTLGQKDKAREAFNNALTLDPQNQIARQGLVETSK